MNKKMKDNQLWFVCQVWHKGFNGTIYKLFFSLQMWLTAGIFELVKWNLSEKNKLQKLINEEKTVTEWLE